MSHNNEQSAISEWEMFIKEQENKGRLTSYYNNDIEAMVGTTNTATGEKYDTIEQARTAYMKITREIEAEQATRDAATAEKQAAKDKYEEEWRNSPEGQEFLASRSHFDTQLDAMHGSDRQQPKKAFKEAQSSYKDTHSPFMRAVNMLIGKKPGWDKIQQDLISGQLDDKFQADDVAIEGAKYGR